MTANVPVEFYGVVLDDVGRPIAGIELSARLARWRPLDWWARPTAPYGMEYVTNTIHTDPLGRFSVSGETGASLAIVFEDARFELAPGTPTSFGFGPNSSDPHHPDADHPVEYRVWRRGGGVELMRHAVSRKVRADGTLLTLDLDSGLTAVGSVGSSGVSARVWREPLRFDYREATPEVWRYELSFGSGGLRTTEDLFCYVAPTDGYASSFGETMRRGEANYRYRVSRKFYLRTGGSLYGRGVLEVWADRMDDTALVKIEVWLNPDGGMNLEPRLY